MTKKKQSLSITEDLSGIFTNGPRRETPNFNGMTIEQALNAVVKQMEATGLRARTVSDYVLHVTDFASKTHTDALQDVSASRVYEWLSGMSVSNQTKLTRLKCVKAFFERCADNGWLTERFWRNIKIKVDAPVKEGAEERDVYTLLSVLDLSDFVQLRDATAIMTMFQTGIRLGTLSALEERHIDLEARLLRIPGDIIKNHEALLLPFDEKLARLFSVLMRQNAVIRREHKKRNDLVFITQHGEKIASSMTNNNIGKRLNKYAKEYGLRNINPHALRRGFAKKLLDRGENLAVISKALGHSDLAVTSRYLHLDSAEVVESLRRHL